MAKKERLTAERSLVCLLQACQGYKTVIEFRDDSFADGVLTQVDGFMNVFMNDVDFTMQGQDTRHFDELFVQAKQIRFVHIPDDINMREAIKRHLKTFNNANKPKLRTPGIKESKVWQQPSANRGNI